MMTQSGTCYVDVAVQTSPPRTVIKAVNNLTNPTSLFLNAGCKPFIPQQDCASSTLLPAAPITVKQTSYNLSRANTRYSGLSLNTTAPVFIQSRSASLPQKMTSQFCDSIRSVSMPYTANLSSQLAAHTQQSPNRLGNNALAVRPSSPASPETPSVSYSSDSDSIEIIDHCSPLSTPLLRPSYPRKRIDIVQPLDAIADDEGWIKWSNSPPKPIPALHGPLALPYARCPSGAEGTLMSQSNDPARLVWGLTSNENSSGVVHQSQYASYTQQHHRYPSQEKRQQLRNLTHQDRYGMREPGEAVPVQDGGLSEFQQHSKPQYQPKQQTAAHPSLSRYLERCVSPPGRQADSSYTKVTAQGQRESYFQGSVDPRIIHQRQTPTVSTVVSQTTTKLPSPDDLQNAATRVRLNALLSPHCGSPSLRKSFYHGDHRKQQLLTPPSSSSPLWRSSFSPLYNTKLKNPPVYSTQHSLPSVLPNDSPTRRQKLEQARMDQLIVSNALVSGGIELLAPLHPRKVLPSFRSSGHPEGLGYGRNTSGMPALQMRGSLDSDVANGSKPRAFVYDGKNTPPFSPCGIRSDTRRRFERRTLSIVPEEEIDGNLQIASRQTGRSWRSTAPSTSSSRIDEQRLLVDLSELRNQLSFHEDGLDRNVRDLLVREMDQLRIQR